MQQKAPPTEPERELRGYLSPWAFAAQRVPGKLNYMYRPGSLPGTLGNSLSAYTYSSNATLKGLGLENFVDIPHRPKQLNSKIAIGTDCGPEFNAGSLGREGGERDLTQFMRNQKLAVGNTVERQSPYWERHVDLYKSKPTKLGAPVAHVFDDPLLKECDRVVDPGVAAKGPQRAVDQNLLDASLRSSLYPRVLSHQYRGIDGKKVTQSDREYLAGKGSLWMQSTDERMTPELLDKIPREVRRC